ncbi:MAG TPA: NfeD family protein [Bacteroidales bacterium]|nr:NfeD family protein [Bacteroidales bacterium]
MNRLIRIPVLICLSLLLVANTLSYASAFATQLKQETADTIAVSDSNGDPAEADNIPGLSDSISEGAQKDTIGEKKVPLVYVYEIKEMIAKPIWRTTKLAFAEARELGADLVLIDMNTYGGEVSAADSIRTFILNSEIPVYVFINDNAASAGALISIACDSIYMKPSAKIGAATVVNQSGEQVPDKFQSYMRATMRATAEAQGKDTVVVNGDTSLVWRRDPAIAEAMVDPKLFVPGVSDTGQVLTFTATEAVENGFCEGIINTRKELLELVEIEEYTLKEYNPSRMDKIIGFLISPYVSSILIMVIIGGIYFELQSPGIGFPIAASALAALLYFAPLYLEGMAEYWELLIFILGIILLLVEVFVIPGFGVAGAAGVLAVIFGLAMSMVNNDVLRDFEFTGEGMNLLMRSFGVVTVSAVVGLSVSIWAASKVLTTNTFARLVLGESQNTNEGYISVDTNQRTLVGKTGTAYTVLRPSGKVQVDDEIYDGKAEFGLIEKGDEVKIIRYESGQVYVVKA